MKKLVFTLLTVIPMLSFAAITDSYDLSKYSHKHKCKCERGATGATGGNFSVPVAGDTLTATVHVLTEIFGEAPTGSTVTPYVSTPDGLVLEGTATLLIDLPTTVTFPTVNPVVGGTYTYGLLLTGSGIVISAQTLPVIISDTADGTTTTSNIFIPFYTSTTSENQFNTQFVYNGPSFP